MKLVTFLVNGQSTSRIGIRRDDDSVVALSADQKPAFASMLALIDAGEAGLAAARDALTTAAEVLEPGAFRLLAPLPEPRQMRDALCFEKHLRQARANRHLFGMGGFPADPAKVEIPQVWYDQPVYYKCNRFSVVGPEAEVFMPQGEDCFDYELEFGVIIGKRGRDIPRDQAMSHVFGYVIFNDFSARRLQLSEMQGGLGPAKGKDFDSGNVLGPWLVTADEIDPGNLTMIARVNGEEWSRGSSSEMHHSVADVIAHISRDETIHPGEFIGSGTVGNGCGLELGRFLTPGDVVELEIGGLGLLRNRVHAARV